MGQFGAVHWADMNENLDEVTHSGYSYVTSITNRTIATRLKAESPGLYSRPMGKYSIIRKGRGTVAVASANGKEALP